MPNIKSFSEMGEMVEVRFTMPASKVAELKTISTSNGLSVSSYIRTLLFSHLGRIARANSEEKGS